MLVVHPVEVGLQQGETVRMFFMLHIEVIITLYGDINKKIYTFNNEKHVMTNLWTRVYEHDYKPLAV